MSSIGNADGCCVIMAGGRGTRFWPMSRKATPKHLLPLGKTGSLLRETIDRVVPLVGIEKIIVITNADQRDSVMEQIPELLPENVIGEPRGLNTAACAVLGAGIATKLTNGAPFALLPADHYIPDPDQFTKQLKLAFDTASNNETVVTFGITPTSPATGYGYIEIGTDENSDVGICFVEKPNLETAMEMVSKNTFFWNSGMFIWNANYFIDEATNCMPDIFNAISPAVKAWRDGDFISTLNQVYQNCPAKPIDTALMEKLETFTVHKAEFRWSDLGSWDAWGDLADEIGDGNRGIATDLISVNSKNSIIHADGKTVALIGVDNLVVVDTDDALLVCDKNDTQSLREVIGELESRGSEDLL